MGLRQMAGHGQAGRRVVRIGFVVAASISLGSCGGSITRQAETNPQVFKLGDTVPEGGGVRKTGSRYQIKGRWYQPQQTAYANQVGVASWYGEYFHGRKTANGEWYDMGRLSAAHPTMPLPSYVRVTNLANKRSIVVRVNDRGPYASERIIDMSRAAADKLGFVRQGTTRVSVRYIGEAPLEGDVRDMQIVDGGSRGTRARRPIITASTHSPKTASPPMPRKKSAVAAPGVAIQGTKSSPLADELLATGPLSGRPEAASVPPGKILPRKTRPTATLSTKPLKLIPPRPLPEKTSAAKSGFFVQTASFRELDRARSLREELAHLGIFDILPVEIGTDTFYRVRLGPFADAAGAEQARRRISGAGHRDAHIFSR